MSLAKLDPPYLPSLIALRDNSFADGNTRFYTALRKAGYKTIAEVPPGEAAVVLKIVEAHLGAR